MNFCNIMKSQWAVCLWEVFSWMTRADDSTDAARELTISENFSTWNVTFKTWRDTPASWSGWHTSVKWLVSSRLRQGVGIEGCFLSNFSLQMSLRGINKCSITPFLWAKYASVRCHIQWLRSSNIINVHFQRLLSMHCNGGVLFKHLFIAGIITSLRSVTKGAAVLPSAPWSRESMWWGRRLKNASVTVSNRSAINASHGSRIGECSVKLILKRVRWCHVSKQSLRIRYSLKKGKDGTLVSRLSVWHSIMWH